MPEVFESPTFLARRQSLFCPAGVFHHRPSKGPRWLLRSPRHGAASRLRPGFAPDVFSPSCRSWILRHLPFPWDAEAGAGSTVGLFVCSCLARMGLILSLAALAVLGCVLGAGKVLGTLQFWLLLLTQQQRCPFNTPSPALWGGQDPGRGHGQNSPKLTRGTFQTR